MGNAISSYIQSQRASQFHLCHDQHQQRELSSQSESTLFSVVHSRSGTGPNSQRNRHDLLPIRQLAQLDRFQRCKTHHCNRSSGIHRLLRTHSPTWNTGLSNRINTARHNRRLACNQRYAKTSTSQQEDSNPRPDNMSAAYPPVFLLRFHKWKSIRTFKTGLDLPSHTLEPT